MLTLVIGGARSGKSRFAQTLCQSGACVAFIATARADDEEMRARIARHRQDRPREWVTIEEPLAISQAVARQTSTSDFVLLDCLTVWLGNLCYERQRCGIEELERAASEEVERLVSAAAAARVVVVTNEVGCGIVPESSLGRLFQDLQGFVNQKVAVAAEVVYHVVAGIPVAIKGADRSP